MASANGSGSGRKAGPAFVRRVLPWVVCAAIAVFIAAGFRKRAVVVGTAAVARAPLTVSVLEEGKTRIRHRYVVAAPVGGLLDRPPLRAGAAIEAGKTVLAEVMPAPSALLDERTRSEAEARVLAAEAAASQAEAAVDRAAADLDLARKENARAAGLLRTRAVSVQEAEAAASREVVADRSHREAEFAARVARFSLEQAKAALLPGGADPDSPRKVVMKSPVDGVVLNVMEESARMIPAGTPIMEIGDPRDIEAEIEMLSIDAVAVKPGADVAIEQWGGGEPFPGRVVLVEPGAYTKISSLGVEEQRVRVRVDFVDPPPEAAALGDRYRVEARIVTWQSDSVLQVPVAALFRRGNEWMTFRLDDGRARLTTVGIDRNNGEAAAVVSGLSEGDTVILYPPDTLEDGDRVRPSDG